MRMIDVERITNHSDCVHYELCRDFLGGGRLLDDKVKCDYYTEKPKPCKTCNYWNGDLKYCMKWSAFMDADDFCSEHWREGDEE